jgi:hypothetical protein|tara:strand:+ start:2003 stop:2644 length:642 start_codon:yes stop_codon:yes gene_type:complete
MAWTFTTLKTAIQDYTQNSETTFVNNLSNFITDTEEKILKTVNLPVFRKNVTGTMTSGNTYLSAPSDFLTPFSLALDNSGYEYLMFKEVNFIREAYPVSSTTGVPKYYALFDDDTFILGPTPNANFTVELHYVYRPTSITTSADGTSWLGTNAPDALLYGSLVQAYSFMKGEADLIANYTQQYNEALSRLKVFAEGRSTKDAYRTGIIRQQVT